MSQVNQPDIRFPSPLQRVVTVELPCMVDADRGSLTVIQGSLHVPFHIARVFYMYGVAAGQYRGAHAHRHSEQFFVAIAGRMFLELSDSRDTRLYTLARPSFGVYAPAMVWARIHDFSPDAVCLVLASTPYDPLDYIRSWDEYLSLMSSAR